MENLNPISTNNPRLPDLDAIPSKIRDYSLIDKMWERVQQYYQEHKLDEAYMEYTNFKKELLLINPNCSIPPQRQQFIKKIEE